MVRRDLVHFADADAVCGAFRIRVGGVGAQMTVDRAPCQKGRAQVQVDGPR